MISALTSKRWNLVQLSIPIRLQLLLQCLQWIALEIETLSCAYRLDGICGVSSIQTWAQTKGGSPAPTKLYLASDSPPTTLSSKKLCWLPLATFRYAATGVKRSAGISMNTGTRFGVVDPDLAGSEIFAEADVEGYVDSDGGLSVEGE